MVRLSDEEVCEGFESRTNDSNLNVMTRRRRVRFSGIIPH